MMMQSLEPHIFRGYEILVNSDERARESGNGARDEPNRIHIMVKVWK